MNRADLSRMAREAGFDECHTIVGEKPVQALSHGRYMASPVVRSDFHTRHIEVLERFAALAAADARAARIAAQTENEALKARLAASGVAERRAVREAVLAEREACARLAQDWNTAMTDKLAAAMRARGAA